MISAMTVRENPSGLDRMERKTPCRVTNKGIFSIATQDHRLSDMRAANRAIAPASFSLLCASTSADKEEGDNEGNENKANKLQPGQRLLKSVFQAGCILGSYRRGRCDSNEDHGNG